MIKRNFNKGQRIVQHEGKSFHVRHLIQFEDGTYFSKYTTGDVNQVVTEPDPERACRFVTYKSAAIVLETLQLCFDEYGVNKPRF